MTPKFQSEERGPDLAETLRKREVRIGLFNVMYSPNLGDGLLSESLKKELLLAEPRFRIRTFDLAGRTTYLPGSRLRGAVLRLLQSSPTPIRHKVAGILLGRFLRRIRPTWRRELADVDVAVMGGGNLFSDADLNFPLKIDAAFSELRAAGIPTAVFAVGVADNWSKTGSALICRGLCGSHILDASVRDLRSAEIWNRRLEPFDVPRARVVHDPGLLIARHVPQVRKEGGPLRIGLGFTHPTTLSYHADEELPGGRALTEWYVELVRGCVARGWQVVAFTNGSSEDEAYMHRVRQTLSEMAALSGSSATTTFAPRFANPTELATFISGLDFLMAHRLHANITAYAYGVPQIGFAWDSKLASFFSLVGRGDYVRIAGRGAIDEILALVDRGLREGLDSTRHRRTIEQACAEVAGLAETLKVGASLAARRREAEV